MVVDFPVKVGKEAEFERVFHRSVTCSRLEPGNITFNVHRVIDQPRHYVLYEQWRSVDALNSHFARPLHPKRSLRCSIATSNTRSPMACALSPICNRHREQRLRIPIRADRAGVPIRVRDADPSRSNTRKPSSTEFTMTIAYPDQLTLVAFIKAKPALATSSVAVF
ncbi:MAG: antibiotic biosynthesis monooxygenase family protein [Rhizomicrobium sp.]